MTSSGGSRWLASHPRQIVVSLEDNNLHHKGKNLSTPNNAFRSNANEKKVWRPLYATQASAPANSPESQRDAIHFIAVEELQGAHINGQWEEADGGVTEEWDESVVGPDGSITLKTIRKEIPRATRYVLKYFSPDGRAKNALSSYDGNREYKQ